MTFTVAHVLFFSTFYTLIQFYIGYSRDGDMIEIYLAFHIEDFVMERLLLADFFIYLFFNVSNIQ